MFYSVLKNSINVQIFLYIVENVKFYDCLLSYTDCSGIH